MSRDSRGILALHELSRRFGEVRALSSITVELGDPGITGLIGPNGSGKTTLLNLVSGSIAPSGGRILWDRRDITGWAPYRIARLGVRRTFQQNMSFGSLTVLQNLTVGLEAVGRDRSDIDELFDLHDMGPHEGLRGYANVAASELPFGIARILGLAVAMAGRPRLLLLDEPAAGLNDAEADGLAFVLKRVVDTGTAILMVDHDMSFLMPLCRRVVVLDAGQVIADGQPDAVRAEERVISVYLGGRTEARSNAAR